MPEPCGRADINVRNGRPPARAETTPGHDADAQPPSAACGIDGPSVIIEVLRHLAFALSAHVQRLRAERQAVPREVGQLTAVLVSLASTRQNAPRSANGPSLDHHAPVPDRLLVTKGEAAERLGVSVRTVERLVATGRLRQVHIERLARLRVKDLEAYVDSLGDDDAPYFASADVDARNCR